MTPLLILEIAGLAVLAIALAFGGLAALWAITARLELRRRGYRVVAGTGWLRWRQSIGTQSCVYLEADRAGALPFRRQVLGRGYPAPSRLEFPRADAWDAQAPAWARGRRTQILARVVDGLGGPAHVGIADAA